MLLLLCLQTKGQVNYVQNSSFEQYSQCPDAWDEINRANYWSSIDSLMQYTANSDAIPEYCNACADTNSTSEIYVGVPSSSEYYHYPHTGNGMALERFYFDSASAGPVDAVDYLQSRLYKTLNAGTSYCVSFYVTMAQSSGYAINKIGAYLDDGKIDTTHHPASPQTEYVPQVYETSVINDTLNWHKVEGTFTANGTERFITIGNFFPNNRITATYLDNSTGFFSFAFYLVDDVSVVESDLPAYAGNDTSIRYGDTILIGRNEEALDCKWYVAGNLIDSGAGIHVHPDTTTTYVVAQTVCGLVKYDTCVVTVWPLGVDNVKGTTFAIYPNPASDQITVVSPFEKAALNIVNMLGQVVYTTDIKSVKQTVSLSLSSGVYMAELVTEDGQREVQQLVIAK